MTASETTGVPGYWHQNKPDILDFNNSQHEHAFNLPQMQRYSYPLSFGEQQQQYQPSNLQQTEHDGAHQRPLSMSTDPRFQLPPPAHSQHADDHQRFAGQYYVHYSEADPPQQQHEELYPVTSPSLGGDATAYELPSYQADQPNVIRSSGFSSAQGRFANRGLKRTKSVATNPPTLPRYRNVDGDAPTASSGELVMAESQDVVENSGANSMITKVVSMQQPQQKHNAGGHVEKSAGDGEGGGGGRNMKGLRRFSRMVADKVQIKGSTTYNEVADELVEELEAQARERGTKFDQKNIRRRVYDALNVLMALEIIVKDKKEIRWKGFPLSLLIPASAGVGSGGNGQHLMSEQQQQQQQVEAECEVQVNELSEKVRGQGEELERQKVLLLQQLAQHNSHSHPPFSNTHANSTNIMSPAMTAMSPSLTSSTTPMVMSPMHPSTLSEDTNTHHSSGFKSTAEMASPRTSSTTITRSDNTPSTTTPSANVIPLPFLLIRSPSAAQVNIQSAQGGAEFLLNFSHPFTIHEDIEVVEHLIQNLSVASVRGSGRSTANAGFDVGSSEARVGGGRQARVAGSNSDSRMDAQYGGMVGFVDPRRHSYPQTSSLERRKQQQQQQQHQVLQSGEFVLPRPFHSIDIQDQRDLRRTHHQSLPPPPPPAPYGGFSANQSGSANTVIERPRSEYSEGMYPQQHSQPLGFSLPPLQPPVREGALERRPDVFGGLGPKEPPILSPPNEARHESRDGEDAGGQWRASSKPFSIKSIFNRSPELPQRDRHYQTQHHQQTQPPQHPHPQQHPDFQSQQSSCRSSTSYHEHQEDRELPPPPPPKSDTQTPPRPKGTKW
ncbi:hypothetical protein HK102_002098, partial [Quaeritorhiza haematococci]